jgi:hypothetical protein
MRGHELSDCRGKKKNVEENHEEMNKTTEVVACVAREVDDNENENLARIGTCVICGKTSMAFMYCEYCGKDSGAICSPSQERNEDFVYEQSTTDSGNTANINVKDSPDYSTTKTYCDEEVDLCSIDKLDGVFMSNVYNTKEHINYSEDVFTNISIADFFAKIYDEDKWENFQRSEEDYINARVDDMELFNYHSVPAILQNICNLNFNTRLYNEHYLELLKSSQRPRQLIWEFTEYERHKMIECGVEMMQQYVLDNMTMKNPDGQGNTVTAAPPAIEKKTINPDE